MFLPLKDIILTLDKRAAYASEENLQTGELIIPFGNTLNDQDDIFINLGGSIINKLIDFKMGGLKPVDINGERPLSIKYDEFNKCLLINLRVYDFDGNLIAEIENNHWRPNKKFTGRFNYDTKGFEVIDNQGNIAINIDIINNKTIKIQGIFARPEAIFLCGTNINMMVSGKASVINKEEFKKGLGKSIKEIDIKQLFENYRLKTNPLFYPLQSMQNENIQSYIPHYLQNVP